MIADAVAPADAEFVQRVGGPSGAVVELGVRAGVVAEAQSATWSGRGCGASAMMPAGGRCRSHR